jgi:hypothetical protein
MLELSLFGEQYAVDPDDVSYTDFSIDACFYYNMPCDYKVETVLRFPQLEWGNSAPRTFACVVYSFSITSAVCSFLYRRLGMGRAFDYVHVLNVTTMELYIFPYYRFKQAPQVKFSSDSFSVWDTHESYYYSVYGTWYRTYVRKRYVNPKKIQQKNFVWYCQAEGGGALYSALWHRNLIIYVPPDKEVEGYLLLFISTILRMGGTLAVVDQFREPSTSATSYDVCHRVTPSGLCDKYLAHARFCRVVGVPSDSSIFSSAEFLPHCTEIPLNSVYFPYPEQNDRLFLDGQGEPVWKHFCTVCAYPHRVFGMKINGQFFCGPEMPWYAAERCCNKVSGQCTSNCAADYVMASAREIDSIARYVSHYGGQYDFSDSLFPDYEVYYVPSFGYQLVYYVSSNNSVGMLRRCTELCVCTCMIASVPCDSLSCYRKKLMDVEFTVTTNGALFSTGDNVIVPPGMCIDSMFREIKEVYIPHRLIQQCYNSHAMSFGGFSLYDYMYTPHVSLQSLFVPQGKSSET